MTAGRADQEYLNVMLQRIRAFQSHEHPAWKETRAFEERVSGLPLYALEFNNPDRDDKQFGPTVAHYAPAKCEMEALARAIESIGSNPRILDVGCGNGFIGSLLAREGLSVVGIDDLSWNQPQIARFFDESIYKLCAPASLETFDESFNVAFCSWMVPGANLTPLLVARRPALIIHVYSPQSGGNGLPLTGSPKAYRCPDGFRRLGAWTACTPKDYFAEVEPRLSKKGATYRIVELWSRCDLASARFCAPSDLGNVRGYHWDFERDTLNAIRRRRGLPVVEIRATPG